MNISRNNYEEFFLLYIDNELSVQEKIAVDVFVAENPDLEEELLMLQQTILQKDEIIFDNKNQLQQKGLPEEEALNNLLLFLDNELSPKQVEKTKQLILADENIKSEWNILQQTKLRPEREIVFTDKHLLYKKEKSKVVAFAWWRIAVAALFIGGGLWMGLKYYHDSNASPRAGLDVVKKIGQPEKIATSGATQPKRISDENKLDKEKATTENVTKDDLQKISLKQLRAKNNLQQNQQLTTEKNVSASRQENNLTKISNNLPKTDVDNSSIKNDTKTEVATGSVETNSK